MKEGSRIAFMILGTGLFIFYVVGCIYGYAHYLNGWMRWPIVIPPLGLAFPLVEYWKLDTFPWLLALLGVLGLVFLGIGRALGEDSIRS